VATITKGKLIRDDVALFDGVTRTASRVDATGGTVTGLNFGDQVDVLQVFGSGTSRTLATVSSAITRAGSNNRTLLFSTGTWTITDDITIPSNLTCYIAAGCVFSITSGKTLTIAGMVFTENPGSWTSGDGTITLTGGDHHFGVFHRTAAETAAPITPTSFKFSSEPINVRRFGIAGDGSTDDATALNTLNTDYLSGLSNPITLIFPPGRTYAIGAKVKLDLPQGSSVQAQGAKFKCTHNGVAFDLNPTATAAIPNASASTDVKRDITWVGGQFENTNGTKTLSVAIQAYMMRVLRLQDIHFGSMGSANLGFYAAVKFAGLDSYRFIDCYSFDCVRHYWVPTAGTVYAAATSSHDLIDIEWRGCHMSVEGDEAGIYMENRCVHFHVNGGTFNGAATVAHVRLEDNATVSARDIHFSGAHFEQMGASVPAVLFVESGTKGFHSVSFDGGCEFTSATVGWYGITLDKCFGVDIAAANFTDGSAGATERCIYVDDDSRRITIGEATFFGSIAAGQAIVLETATNRKYVTIEPEFAHTGGPAGTTSTTALTSFAPTAKSTTGDTSLDMSAELSTFANFLLPPKGYFFTTSVNDSASAAAGANTCWLKLRLPGSPTTFGGVHNTCVLQPNDSVNHAAGYVAADENGDVTWSANATGASTLDVGIAVTAVHQ